MAAGYNRVMMIGNLTRDPEYKQLASGQAVCRLGLATNRQFENKQTGSMVQEVCYIDIDVWGPQAESCRQHLKKGRAVFLEGRIKYDTWKDQATGQTRSKHSIVADRVYFLDSTNKTAEQDSETVEARNETATAYESDPSNALEKELLAQINQVKSRMQPAQKEVKKEKPAPTTAPSTGEINYKDQQPFEDDLPF